MLQKIRNVLYRLVGLGRLRDELQKELAHIKLLLQPAVASHGEPVTTASLVNLIDERLNYYFRWRMPVAIGDQLLIHTNDGQRLYVDRSEPFMTLHLLEHGEWETPVRRELKRLLKPGDTFIDIGANIGLHVLYATTLIGPTGHIVAMEPHPVTHELLRQNLEINGLLDRVFLSDLAASDKDDAVVPFEYFREHPAMSGLKVSPQILAKFKGTVEQIDVTTVTLDKLLEREGLMPSLVKIDVEGFEHAVLQGCRQTLKAHPDTVFMIEYEREMAEAVMRPGIGAEIAEFFRQHGFVIYKIGNEALIPLTPARFAEETRGDYIFSRS